MNIKAYIQGYKEAGLGSAMRRTGGALKRNPKKSIAGGLGLAGLGAGAKATLDARAVFEDNDIYPEHLRDDLNMSDWMERAKKYGRYVDKYKDKPLKASGQMGPDVEYINAPEYEQLKQMALDRMKRHWELLSPGIARFGKPRMRVHSSYEDLGKEVPTYNSYEDFIKQYKGDPFWGYQFEYDMPTRTSDEFYTDMAGDYNNPSDRVRTRKLEKALRQLYKKHNAIPLDAVDEQHAVDKLIEKIQMREWQ
jgi:hypothetical protein